MRHLVALAVDVDDEPVGIRQQKGFVRRETVDLEHHAGSLRLKLRDADFLEESIVDIEAFAYERGGQLRIPQIEEDTIWMRNSLRTKFHFAFQVNRHSSVVRSRPVPDCRDS